MKIMDLPARLLFLIILAIDLIWVKSSFSKLSSGNFARELKPVLEKFAGQNPYPLIKDFLNMVAIPNHQIFGFLTMWGETLVAVSLFISVSYILLKGYQRLASFILMVGLFGGMFLNMIFWLSSGWMSPSSDGLNLLMFLIETLGVVFAGNLFFAGKSED